MLASAHTLECVLALPTQNTAVAQPVGSECSLLGEDAWLCITQSADFSLKLVSKVPVTTAFMVGGLMTRMVARRGRKLVKVVATTTVGMAALFYFFTTKKLVFTPKK